MPSLKKCTVNHISLRTHRTKANFRISYFLRDGPEPLDNFERSEWIQEVNVME